MDERLNTVSAQGQVRGGDGVWGEGDGRPRIVFLGNSMALHAPREEIGWPHFWGMAASAREKDYVHLVMAAARKEHPEASFRIAQCAQWERAYWEGTDILSQYKHIAQWNADVIIAMLGANCPVGRLDEYPLAPAYGKLLDFFNPHGTARLIIVTLFWPVPQKDAAIREAARGRGVLVEIGHLGSDRENLALERFEHQGVGMHPGDLGMRRIAEAMLGAVATF